MINGELVMMDARYVAGFEKIFFGTIGNIEF